MPGIIRIQGSLMPGSGSSIIEIMISKITLLIIIGFVAAGIWLAVRHSSAQNVKSAVVCSGPLKN